MSLKNFFKKELYVAIHAQTVRFRVVKYIVITAVLVFVQHHHGWEGVWWTLGIALIAAIAMHFFFRWKTKGWNESWGLYKPPEGMPKDT